MEHGSPVEIFSDEQYCSEYCSTRILFILSKSNNIMWTIATRIYERYSVTSVEQYSKVIEQYRAWTIAQGFMKDILYKTPYIKWMKLPSHFVILHHHGKNSARQIRFKCSSQTIVAKRIKKNKQRDGWTRQVWTPAAKRRLKRTTFILIKLNLHPHCRSTRLLIFACIKASLMYSSCSRVFCRRNHGVKVTAPIVDMRTVPEHSPVIRKKVVAVHNWKSQRNT